MKILQVNCVYGKGSTGRIVLDLHREIQRRGMESVVCYGRGGKVNEPNIYKTCSEPYAKANNLLSRLTGIIYGGCFFSTNRLISRIKKERPDVVHLHCINGYFVNIYRLVRWLKKRHIKTVLTLHAEFMHTGNCSHAFECEGWRTGCGNCPKWKQVTKSFFLNRTHGAWEKMRKAFEGFSELTVTSVSPWLMRRAKESPILQEHRHVTVLNGVDTSVFFPRQPESRREKHSLEGKKIVFHVTAEFSTAADHPKGGRYVLELAEKMKDDNTVFLVAAGRWDDKLTFPENVIFLGNIADQSLLAEYYSLADATLLTSRRETFSMPVAESLCCGTPVVGFEAGGPEEIALKEGSAFVPYGNISALERALSTALKEKMKDFAPAATEKFDKIKIAEQYIALYE